MLGEFTEPVISIKRKRIKVFPVCFLPFLVSGRSNNMYGPQNEKGLLFVYNTREGRVEVAC